MAQKHIEGLVVQLKMERDWLRARLEVAENGGPDGIECRDETIRMLDKEIDKLRAENSTLRRLNIALQLEIAEACSILEQFNASFKNETI